MLIPRELLDSVVSLGVETADGFHPGGAAYFVTLPATLVPDKQHTYLVTAGHCVRARDNLVTRLNAPGGGTVVDLLPPEDRWLRLAEPDLGEQYVDLAAVRWNPEVSDCSRNFSIRKRKQRSVATPSSGTSTATTAGSPTGSGPLEAPPA